MDIPTRIQINGNWFTTGNLDEIYQFTDQDSDKKWITEIIQFLEEWFRTDAFVQANTSGSTGIPKTVQLRKSAMVQSAINTIEYFKLTKDDIALLCLPSRYIAGKMMLVRAMVAGFNIMLQKPESNPFINLFHDIDFTAITPHQLAHSIDTLKKKSIKKIIVGGAPVSANMQKGLENFSSTLFFETYGMTETTSHIALKQLNGPGKSDYFSPLPGVKISIDNKNCLVIHAKGITEKEIVTNDIVEFNDKRQFKWLGRFDNIINSGGIKIIPEQLEKKLLPYLQTNFFITSIEDETLHEKIALVLEESEKTKDLYISLIKKLPSDFTAYEIPKALIFIEKFNLELNNKINRKETIKDCKTIFI